jgi:hypothetical protein
MRNAGGLMGRPDLIDVCIDLCAAGWAWCVILLLWVAVAGRRTENRKTK